ncbi:uncharacterized protein LOC113205797 isoform X2 [Frankliniella occidentalis]|uniref:Uncharacterized protein LOC113205797 isoform X2 n=1 Tax=Frankliniella occidentalis TaxID=133901 RepID=A0A9C6TWC1_FRAOC|nr:uncharacterized protein LOC113205797 isoform X2 [Frankliniella occidentalis]
MEQLPDAALVMVMQYLNRNDLFTCRLVCKRLGAVAVHPNAWRGRSHMYCNSTAFRACPVLRIAPCLNYLEIHMLSEEMFQCCQLMLATTRCAVRSVAVSLSGSERGVLRLAALLLRRQEALGGLRAVKIELCEEDENGDDASVLLATVASMPDLKRLVVAGITANKPNLVSHYFTSSSLEYFECELRPESASFCTFIIAAHANALQEVDLAGRPMEWICSSSTSLAPLLAGLPNLRKLRSRMLPGLEALADSTSLRELSLVVRPADQPGVGGAAALLSRAKQLRAVTLE